MTKPTDNSLIEDTEIPAQELVEDLLVEDEIAKIVENSEDEDHATIIDEEDDESNTIIEIDGEKIADRRRPADRRKSRRTSGHLR